MSAWLDALRETAGPLIDRLRAIDDLEPREELTPGAVVAALEESGFPDDGEVARGLVRLVPKEHWVALVRQLDRHSDGHYFSVQFCAELDFRLVSAAIAALDGPDERFALSLLVALWSQELARPELDAIWPTIERRIADSDFEIAYRATVLATAARRGGRTLLGGLERALAALAHDRRAFAFLDEDDEDDVESVSYGFQVEIENLFCLIAECGTTLSALASSLAPVLQSDIPAWRASALLASVGIGADSLRPALESLASSGASDGIEGALASYACWSFGAGADHLARALAFAAPPSIAQSRLENALAVSPSSDRLLRALCDLALEPAWAAIAYRVLAKHGPPAAKILRGLPELGPEHDAYVWDCRARWRCGVRSPAESCRAFERILGEEWNDRGQAWSCYLELASTDAEAFARVQKEVSVSMEKNPHPCGGALACAIPTAARVLPELVRGGYDDVVLQLHRALPTDTFWSNVGD